MTRKVILYIAMSLDGYVAAPGDDLSFLSVVEREGEDYGYNQFVASVDTVILGRKTYDWVMTQVPVFPHEDMETYIVSRTKTGSVGNARYYGGDLAELVNELRTKPGKDIFIDGGAELVTELLRHHLIDEMIISVIPMLLGNGTRLFKDGRPAAKQELISTKQFDSGLVQLHYRRATQ